MQSEHLKLRQAIGELLGWTVEPHVPRLYGGEPNTDGITVYRLLYPDGVPFFTQPTEDRAWQHLPNWPEDIGAAHRDLVPLMSRPCENEPSEGSYLRCTHCWKHGWAVDLIFCHHDGDVFEQSVLAPTMELGICAVFLLSNGADAAEIPGVEVNKKIVGEPVHVLFGGDGDAE